MIPIYATTPNRSKPIVSYTIITINIVIFIYLIMNIKLNYVNQNYGLVPAHFSYYYISNISIKQKTFSLISYMFLHAGLLHIISNMWALFIFGTGVEDRLGHFRFLLLFFLCGVGSGLTHVLLNLDSFIPTIGASGAVSGVIGAYLILFPKSKILTFIPLIIIPVFLIEIYAFIFFWIWFILQFINVMYPEEAIAEIAWWAHIGGFISGIIFVLLDRFLFKKGRIKNGFPRY